MGDKMTSHHGHRRGQGSPVNRRMQSTEACNIRSCKPGQKVTRGKDWSWGNQDGGAGSIGTVAGCDAGGNAKVQWPHSQSNFYFCSSNRTDLSPASCAATIPCAKGSHSTGGTTCECDQGYVTDTAGTGCIRSNCPNPTGAGIVSAGDNACSWESKYFDAIICSKTGYPGGPMVNGNAGGSSATDCRDKCNALSTCRYWDWDGTTCRLRSGNAGQTSSTHYGGPKGCLLSETDCKAKCLGDPQCTGVYIKEHDCVCEDTCRYALGCA